jgi:hypothetical protein
MLIASSGVLPLIKPRGREVIELVGVLGWEGCCFLPYLRIISLLCRLFHVSANFFFVALKTF